MRVVIANTKGGVGKSTTAMQVFIPYNYQKSGSPTKLIEFDDENQDSQSFVNSDIVNAKQLKVSGDIESGIIENISQNENIVIDIGGNKSTTIVLEKLADTGMSSLIDMFVIPLTDGEQDAINAINTYNKVKEINDTAKIIFALSRCDSNMDTELQFIDFFGDTKNRIDGREGLIKKIDDSDRNIIKVYNSDVIKYSRLFGITAFEIANFDTNELQEKLKEATKSGDTDRVKKIAYRLTIVNKAKKYRDSVLQPCFKTIEEVMQ